MKPQIHLSLEVAQHLYDLMRSAPWVTCTPERNTAWGIFCKKLDEAKKRNEKIIKQ